MDNRVNENRSIGWFILFKVLSDVFLGMLVFSLFFGALVVLFSVILGIYNLIYTLFIILFYRGWIEDINLICNGDGKHTTEILKYYLLSIVTFGIYTYFWEYSLQNRLESNASRYNVVITENGSTVLLWDLLGGFLLGIGPLISLHIMFESSNKLAHAYNQNSGRVAPQPMPAPQPQPLPQPQPMPQPQPSPQPMPQSNTMGQVRCIKGMAAGQGFRLPPNRKIVIGKNPSKATLVINESYVSNVHCTIQYNAGNNTYIVTDHSTNGTYVNGIKLQKDVPMAYPAGTVLMLVNSNIEIKLG